MKKKLTLLLLCYFLIQNLFSQNKLSIGADNSFENFTLVDTSIVLGEENRDYIKISENEYYPTLDTDLLIHFNNRDFADQAGNYIVTEHYNNISDIEKKLGSASAFFLKNRGITFTSRDESLFSPGRLLSDFSIEFWLYPTIISEDTTVFSWKGVNKVDEEFIQQKIKFYFEDRKAVWIFENLFVPVDFNKYKLKLKSISRILPNQWNHYLIRYNYESGLVEFLINGIPEDIQYSTKTFKEEKVIYSPYIGSFSKTNLSIGERYRGFIDELRISESYIKKPILSKYKNSGKFYSPIYKLSQESVLLKNILINDNKSPETELLYSFRVSNEPFTSENTILKWQDIRTFDGDLEGKYLQLKGEMYSNGDNKLTPSFESIELYWDDIPKPPAPNLITSNVGEKSLTISWNPVKHYNIDGYYIYIGNEKNNYTEIIDVGKNTSYTIENLISKKIYYFSLRSYYKNTKSDYSIEKFNRPK